MIYFDNAATTQVDDEVLDEIMPFLKENYYNPGGLYKASTVASEAIENARDRVSKLINCKPEQIIFTSGGSESNNLAIKGSYDFLIKKHGRAEYVSSMIEHDSVLNTISYMVRNRNAHIMMLPVNRDGVVDTGFLSSWVSDSTGMVSVMYVNNEIGSINPVSEISEICRKRSILFHTDCVQALGSIDVDVTKIGCDFASASSHKIHAPKGSGFLYVKDKSYINPIISGGDGQEFGLRGGTQNVPAIVGLGKACEILCRDKTKEREKISKLKSYFIKEITESLGSVGIDANLNTPINSCCKVVNISVGGIDSQTLVIALGSMGDCISAGSACRSAETTPSKTLTAIGISPDRARSSFRVSFSKYNTPSDVDKLVRDITTLTPILKS